MQHREKKMVGRGLVCDECTKTLCRACYNCIKKCERYHPKRRLISPAVDRFFKFVMGKDRSKHLYLPPEFACKVKHLTNQETQIEDADGKRWFVTLSCVNGSLAFQKGWQRFYLDHGLKEGQLLVFNHTKGSHFTVLIFGTNACESINFNNEMPRQSKKRRRDQGTALENGLYLAADVNSRAVKPISASANEFQNSKTNIVVQNADFGVPKLLHIEDPVCMINRSDGCHEEEQRNLLNDLSNFEKENRTSRHLSLKNVDLGKARELLQSLQQILDPPQTEQHDANSENASDTNVSRSCDRVLKPTNPAGDDAIEHIKSAAVDTPQTEQGDVNSEASDTNVSSSCNNRVLEPTNPVGDDAMVGHVKSTAEDTPRTEPHDVNLENASDTNISCSCNMALEPTNLAVDDAMEITKSTAEDTPQTEAHDVNLENALDTNISGSCNRVLEPTNTNISGSCNRVLEPTNPAGDDAMEITKSTVKDTPQTEQHDVNIENASYRNISHSCNRVLEPANPAGDDAVKHTTSTVEDTPQTEQHDVNLENASDKNIFSSFNKVLELAKSAGNDAMKHTKSIEEDAEMTMIDTDAITSNSSGIEVKFTNALNAKTAVSLTDQIRKKRDDTQMTPCIDSHSSDAFKDKFFKKSSDNNIMKKGMLDNVCKFQNVVKPEPFSVSPSIDISKIAEREHAGKSKFGENFISNSAIKNPSGVRVIKKEVEMEDKADVFPQVSRGKEPAVVCNNAQMIPPVVKVEPDLFIYETDPEVPDSEVAVPFSAEVKSKPYLELPKVLTSARRRHQIQMAVFLRGTRSRMLWPVVYHEYFGGQAFTEYWTAFCEQNNIKPGDKCTFQIEDYKLRIYKVDVARGSA